MVEREPIMLTNEQTKQLEETTPEFDWLEKELLRAEAAGLDVTEKKAQLAKLRRTQQGMLTTYGRKDSV